MMLLTIIVMFVCLENTLVHHSPDYPVITTLMIPGNHQSNNATGEDSGKRVDEIIPDVEVQNAIRLYLQTPTDRERTDWETQALVLMLRELCQNDMKIIMQQAIYYSMHGKDITSASAFGILHREFDFNKYEMVEAFLPYIHSTDRSLKKEVREIYSYVEDQTAGRNPDYSTYSSYIQIRLNYKQELPRNLIHYMYETNPGEAVLCLSRTIRTGTLAEKKSILWAEHLVEIILWRQRSGFKEKGSVTEETIEALVAVTQSKQWWARMYVAEILRKHPPFRDERILEIMVDETDPSVRAILSEFMQLNEIDPNDRNDGEGETEAESKE